MPTFTPDELDIFDHETYGAVDYVGMYNEENTEHILEKRQKEYDDGIEDRKRTTKQDELYMEETIRRIRDKQNAKNKKLRYMEKRLVNKDFKDDVDEYILRLNTILHSYRFGTEKEYDEIIDFNANKCSYKFTGDQVFVDSHYGGDDDENDSSVALGERNGGLWGLIGTALATSIDAGAVGVGLALIQANIWIIAASIGFSTFVCTAIGMRIGKSIGVRFGKIAELLGGVALIVIGVLILFGRL